MNKYRIDKWGLFVLLGTLAVGLLHVSLRTGLWEAYHATLRGCGVADWQLGVGVALGVVLVLGSMIESNHGEGK